MIPQGHDWGYPTAAPPPARPPGHNATATDGSGTMDASPLPLRPSAVFFRGDTSEGLDCSRGSRGQLEVLHQGLAQRRDQDGDGSPLKERFEFQKGGGQGPISS